MNGQHRMSALPRAIRAHAGVLSIVLCGLACGVIQQHMIGWNELSHFAQVRAFDHGTPIIDPYHRTTGDRAFYHGHFYSDKAPGMAFLLLPAYAASQALGLVAPSGIGTVHLLAVFGCALPLLIMLLLAYRLVERRDPGLGAVVGVMLAFGTLLLPFATILFSHVLSAALGFAAFYLVWRARERDGSLWRARARDGSPERARERDGSLVMTGAAGVLAGYAVGIEYPLGLLAALLGLFVIGRRDPVKPGIAYLVGLIIGLLPLLAYDWWAFGSPLHLSYSYVAANSSGVLGLGAPSLRSALALLISGRGLFVVAPVTAAAIGGIVVLYREGRRLEALIPTAVAAVYFVYNSCYYLPFGGWVPGPRFLITVLPFLAVPLSAAYRRAPLATISLALISAATMITATLTQPLLRVVVPTDTWWKLLGNGKLGTHGATVVAFAICAVLAVAAAARATPRPALGRRDIELALVGVGTWFAMESGAPPLLAHVAITEVSWSLVVLLVIGVALIAVLSSVARGRQLALLAAIPLIVLAPWWFHHPTLMFALAVAALASMLVLVLMRPRSREREPITTAPPPGGVTTPR